MDEMELARFFQEWKLGKVTLVMDFITQAQSRGKIRCRLGELMGQNALRISPHHRQNSPVPY